MRHPPGLDCYSTTHPMSLKLASVFCGQLPASASISWELVSGATRSRTHACSPLVVCSSMARRMMWWRPRPWSSQLARKTQAAHSVTSFLILQPRCRSGISLPSPSPSQLQASLRACGGLTTCRLPGRITLARPQRAAPWYPTLLLSPGPEAFSVGPPGVGALHERPFSRLSCHCLYVICLLFWACCLSCRARWQLSDFLSCLILWNHVPERVEEWVRRGVGIFFEKNT